MYVCMYRCVYTLAIFDVRGVGGVSCLLACLLGSHALIAAVVLLSYRVQSFDFAGFVSASHCPKPETQYGESKPATRRLLWASFNCSWEYGIRAPPQDGVASHFSPV